MPRAESPAIKQLHTHAVGRTATGNGSVPQHLISNWRTQR